MKIKQKKMRKNNEKLMRLFAAYCKEQGEEIPEHQIQKMIDESVILQTAMETSYEMYHREGEDFAEYIERFYGELEQGQPNKE